MLIVGCFGPWWVSCSSDREAGTVWQVSHGFKKSEQNEKLHLGDPQIGHEARIQVLQLPEHSLLPPISESRHVLIVSAGIWRGCPR